MSENIDARAVARRLLHDPQFRYEVEATVEDEHRVQTEREKLVQRARATFEIGVEDNQVWIWINGLKTFGIGDTFAEAYHDALDEITYAIQTLWAEREQELPQ